MSSLHNRHQTLEDLRSELRARSQLLSKELTDLVNANYQDFLGLGRSLQGGDEKIEEIKVALLGFKRNVEGISATVAESVGEVDKLLEEKATVRRDMIAGRRLLDLDARLAELEAKLMVESGSNIEADRESASESEELSDDDDGLETAGVFMSLSKLQRHVQRFLYIQHLMESIGATHPFVAAQQARVMKVKNTLLLDLGAALKHARATGSRGVSPVLKVMALYRDLGEGKEAVRTLKSTSLR